MAGAAGAAGVVEYTRAGVNVGLGTDGFASDMLGELTVGSLLCRHSAQDPEAGFTELPQTLFQSNAAFASRIFGTELGASLRATGSNPNMSRAQGINTNFTKVLGLMLSNGLVALSSALLAQYQGFADVNMGRGAIVIGLAAVIIGEVIFGKIFTNFGLTLLAVSIGAIIYYIVLQIVLQLGLNTNDLKLITALIVAVFLAIPYWKSKMFRRKVQPQSAKNGGNGHA